jgi:hypothetical protein
MHQFPKFTPAWNSICFGQFLCPSSGFYSLYTRHWCMSYRFVDNFRAGPGWNSSSILVLLESSLQTSMTYSMTWQLQYFNFSSERSLWHWTETPSTNTKAYCLGKKSSAALKWNSYTALTSLSARESLWTEIPYYTVFRSTATYDISPQSIRPASWSGGQSFWLLTTRSRVRFPALPWEFSSQGWPWSG